MTMSHVAINFCLLSHVNKPDHLMSHVERAVSNLGVEGHNISIYYLRSSGLFCSPGGLTAVQVRSAHAS